MKSASQSEVSSYACVLERVRKLRSTRPLPTATPPTDYPTYLRARIRQARIRLRLPVYSDTQVGAKKEATTADRIISLLWGFLPIVIAWSFICLAGYNMAVSPLTAPTPAPTIQAFAYSLPPAPAPRMLPDTVATTHAWRSLRQAGYEVTEWKIWTAPQMPASGFRRLDATGGHIRFQHHHSPEHLITVTLRQRGDILSVFITDPKR